MLCSPYLEAGLGHMWMRGCDFHLWGSSLQQFSYQQATGGVLKIREHFPNLFSNLNYKVCDLSLGKPATENPQETSGADFDFDWLMIISISDI